MRFISTLVFFMALCLSTLAWTQTSYRSWYGPWYGPGADPRQSTACVAWSKGLGERDPMDPSPCGPDFGVCGEPDPGTVISGCTGRPSLRSRIQGQRTQLYVLRANAFAKLGDLDNALVNYDLAFAADPGAHWALAHRGDAYFGAGEYQEALRTYNEAVGFEPNNAAILNARAWFLATAPDANVRNGSQAISDALAAINLQSPVRVEFLDTLAAAHAENGEFETAAELQQRAISFLQAGDRESIEDYQSRLDLYLKGMPYRQNINPQG